MMLWVDLGWKSAFLGGTVYQCLHVTELDMVLPFSFLLQSPGSCYPVPLLLYLGIVLDLAIGYFVGSKQHVQPAVF